jgi:CRISPR system Cascade subunit CasE
MMYLSRLTLNLASREVRRDLADCHEMHRTLMCGFPTVEADSDARRAIGVLYRVEPARPGHAPTVIVQCGPFPNWSRLPFAWATAIETKPVGAVVDSIRDGARLRFRLLANATRSVVDDARKRGRRVELTREEDKVDWLRRQASTSGFRLAGGDTTVPAVMVRPTEKLRGGYADDDRRTGRICLGASLFEGILEVTDAGRFREVVTSGLGRGKAYGCGLISVAKAASDG